MGYHIDLTRITLMQYKQSLKEGYLPPSRQVLKENIDARFEIIERHGILRADELFNELKTKRKVEAFSMASGISLDYLTILSREIRSLIKKPVKLIEFTMISTQAAEKLGAAGIKHTVDVYNNTLTEQDRKDLSEKSGISEDDIERIARLADLSRIRWVNHTFAQILYELGYRCAKDVSAADAEVMHKEVNGYIREHNIYKDGIGLRDIKICVEVAGKLEHEMQL